MINSSSPRAVVTMSSNLKQADGTPVALDSTVAGGAHVDGVSAKVLPYEYYKARLSDLANNRAHDGSMLFILSDSSHEADDLYAWLVRAVMHFETSRPNLISMLAGKPHTSTFPITSLNFTYRDPLSPSSDVPVQLSERELAVGLQYSPTDGLPDFLDWLYGLQKLAHGRDRDGTWALTVGNGAQDLIYKVNYPEFSGTSMIYYYVRRSLRS